VREDKATPFGKYELLERLGIGGMATVYRARYTAAPGITKPVVIKRVLSELAENRSFVEQFIHEARISVELSHGNIVQVFDFGQVKGEYFLAMELVDGHPLSRVVKRARTLGIAQLPQPVAASIAIEMCKGLHYAHTRTDENGRPLGLVHRDVSPDNVLLSYTGEVKITDFGIAKAEMAGRPITEAGIVKGKYLFFSPEQALGEALDARSDVYAVGVVLYRMLTGRLPFEGQDYEVLDRVVKGEITPVIQLNREVDRALAQIVMRALAKARGERYQSAEELQQALSRWVATRVPFFTVTTLKHLMGWLYEKELRALGRAPALPQEFLDQALLWREASVDPRPGVESSVETRAAPDSPTDPAQVETQPDVEGSGQPARRREVSRNERSSRSTFGALSGKRGRILAWAVTMAAISLGLVLVILTQRRPPPIEIRSQPLGAQVRLDGVFRGMTPVVLEDVTPEMLHVLELSLLGKQPWQRSYEAGKLPGKIDVNLEAMELPPLEPPPGSGKEPVVEKEDGKAVEREAGKEEPSSTTAQVTTPPAGPPSTPRQPGVKPTARPGGGTGLRVTTADKLSPETAAAKYRQGVKLLSRGQLAKAKEQFWECLAHDPKAARCFRGLGEVSAALGSTEEALEYYSRFLDLDPRGEGAEAARSYIRKTRRERGR
jgi:eukaryotic-like serine/threonine-protein kinase